MSIAKSYHDNLYYFIKDIEKQDKLSKEVSYELLKEYYKTKDIRLRNKIIEGNMRLIISNAKEFHKKINYTVRFEDLISYSCEGMVIGIERYNPEKYNTSFSTYIKYWMDREMHFYCGKETIFSYCPNNLFYKAIKYEKQKKELQEKNPDNKSLFTIEGLSKELDISVTLIKRFEKVLSSKRGDLIYIDSSEETKDMYFDINEEDSDCIPSQFLENKDLSVIIEQIIDSLDAKEQFIIRNRFFYDKKKMTYQEIAKVLGCSFQNVNRIYCDVLKKIKEKLINIEYIEEKNKRISL